MVVPLRVDCTCFDGFIMPPLSRVCVEIIISWHSHGCLQTGIVNHPVRMLSLYSSPIQVDRQPDGQLQVIRNEEKHMVAAITEKYKREL